MPIATPAFDNGSLHAAIMALSLTVDNVASELDELSDAVEGLGPGFLSTTIRLCRTEAELREAMANFKGIIFFQGRITITSQFGVYQPNTMIIGIPCDNGSGQQVMSQIKLDNAGPNTVIFYLDAPDFLIANLELTSAQPLPTAANVGSWDLGSGNHTGITPPGKYPSDPQPDRARIINCHFFNLFCGISASGAAWAGVRHDWVIEKCTFHTLSGNGIELSYKFHGVRIRDCYFEPFPVGHTHVNYPHHTQGNGIWVGNYCLDVQILNCQMRSCRRWGIEIYYCDDSLVEGCTIIDCPNGISIGGNDHHRCIGNTILGAYGVYGPGTAGTLGQIGAIELTDGQGQICSGNTISSKVPVERWPVTVVTDEGPGQIGLVMDPIHTSWFYVNAGTPAISDTLTLAESSVPAYDGTHKVISVSPTRVIVAGTFAGTATAIITVIDRECFCGISLNCGFASKPATQATIVNNSFEGVTFGIQAYNNGAGIQGCLIEGNRFVFDPVPISGYSCAGVFWLNPGADNKVRNNIVRGNIFWGAGNPVSFYYARGSVLDNHHYIEAFYAGETHKFNGFIYLQTDLCSVYVDESGQPQTGLAYTYTGSNQRHLIADETAGSLARVTANYTVAAGISSVLVDAGASNITVTLPDAGLNPGRRIFVSFLTVGGAYTVTVVSAGGTINGAASVSKGAGAGWSFCSVPASGTTWNWVSA
jgi:hypothetical protein